MMLLTCRRFLAVAFLSFLFAVSEAQPAGNSIDATEKTESRPYTILTSGKQLTIKSTKKINNIMLWTPGGNRIVEQKEINASWFTFDVPTRQTFYFLMVGLSDGKIYTEKIGLATGNGQ